MKTKTRWNPNGYSHRYTAGEAMDEFGEQVTFFVELCEPDTGRCHGVIHLSNGDVRRDRVIGAWGVRDVTLTAPVELQRGHKIVTLEASAARPVALIERLYLKLDPVLYRFYNTTRSRILYS